MTFYERLRDLGADPEVLEWVGNRTAKQAWDECPYGYFMAALAERLHLDTRPAAADLAEYVFSYTHPESRLSCAWAIDAARRVAENDEREAARAAASDAWSMGQGTSSQRAAAYVALVAAWSVGAQNRAAAQAFRSALAAVDSKTRIEHDYMGHVMSDIMRRHFTVRQIDNAMRTG